MKRILTCFFDVEHAPVTVTQIGYDAFKDCTSLKTINYGGCEADWNKIIIEEGNESLNQAKIIFNN